MGRLDKRNRDINDSHGPCDTVLSRGGFISEQSAYQLSCTHIFRVGGVSASLLPQKYNSDRYSFYVKRLKRYMIPYAFFSLFNSALKLGVLLITHKLTSNILHDELVELFITGNGTVWFLPTLFLSEVIFFETKEHEWLRYPVAVIGVIIPFILRENINPVLLVAVRAIFAFSYIVIGFTLWNLFKKSKYREKHITSFITGVVLFVVGCFGAFYFDYKVVFKSGTFLNGLAGVPITVFFSFGVILCMYSMQNISNKALVSLQYFGRESLLIMLIHTTILLFFTYPLEGWFKSLTGVKSFVVSMVVFAIVSACTIPIIAVINRWFPILKGEIKTKNE